MKSVYERTKLIITEFDTEDVITTSGEAPTPTEPDVSPLREIENRYVTFSTFDWKGPGGSWF